MGKGWSVDADGRLLVENGTTLIDGNLDLTGTGCTSMPTGLTVIGSMRVAGCAGLEFPDGLKVLHSLFLTERVIVQMQRNLIWIYGVGSLPQATLAGIRTARQLVDGQGTRLNLPILDAPVELVYNEDDYLVVVVRAR